MPFRGEQGSSNRGYLYTFGPIKPNHYQRINHPVLPTAKNMIPVPHICVISCQFDSESFDVSTSLEKLYQHFRSTDHDTILSQLLGQHSAATTLTTSTQEQTKFWKLPQQFNASILLESQLRTLVNDRILRMVKSFHNKSLYEFLGYKSSLLSRERIVQLISEFVFHVSHAMFAWDQTAHEMKNMSTSNGIPTSFSSSSAILQVPTSTDKKICKMLFKGDRSVLSRLGGFDNQSIIV